VTADPHAHVDSAVVNIAVIDDDLARVAFLVTRLEYEPDFRVVGFATDVDEATSTIPGLSPDVVVCDYDLAGADAQSVVQRLRCERPDCVIIVYAPLWSRAAERRLRLVGANACVLTATPPSQLVSLIRSAVGSRRTPAARLG
jgi:two-component system, chemotaxis family, protein-glutamate methylesterase/glutaminase